MNARSLLLCLALLASASAPARDDARPLFESATPLTVELQAPWSELLAHKDEERRYPAVLAYTDAQGRAQRIEATVETRGVTRLRICKFPPLRLRLARDAAAGSDFAGERSLKMVTHCRNGSTSEQYYIQEFLAYRIYNLFSGHSFRVRPLTVTYKDSGGGAPDGSRFAFLIEDPGAVARRNGNKRSRQVQFAPGDFEPIALTRFMLFQYLIGNTDWEVQSGPQKDSCCHNVRVTGAADGGDLVAVPYDFDSAGFINASYAAPHQRLPIKSVTERLYRGFCAHNQALQPVRAEFLANREAILALVEGQAGLSLARKRDTQRYFDAFFTILENDALFARQITEKCRK